jgi:hypothetical protein
MSTQWLPKQQQRRRWPRGFESKLQSTPGIGGEGSGGSYDTCLSHRRGFDFEGKFHYQGERHEVGRKNRARGRVLGKRSRERKKSLDNKDRIMTAMESPWFLVKGS